MSQNWKTGRKDAGVYKRPDYLYGLAIQDLKDAPALGFLEKNLFRGVLCLMRITRRQDLIGKHRSGFIKAVNPAEEVSFLASQIQQAVQKEGLRYREILQSLPEI